MGRERAAGAEGRDGGGKKGLATRCRRGAMARPPLTIGDHGETVLASPYNRKRQRQKFDCSWKRGTWLGPSVATVGEVCLVCVRRGPGNRGGASSPVGLLGGMLLYSSKQTYMHEHEGNTVARFARWLWRVLIECGKEIEEGPWEGADLHLEQRQRRVRGPGLPYPQDSHATRGGGGPEWGPDEGHPPGGDAANLRKALGRGVRLLPQDCNPWTSY